MITLVLAIIAMTTTVAATAYAVGRANSISRRERLLDELSVERRLVTQSIGEIDIYAERIDELIGIEEIDALERGGWPGNLTVRDVARREMYAAERRRLADRLEAIDREISNRSISAH